MREKKQWGIFLLPFIVSFFCVAILSAVWMRNSRTIVFSHLSALCQTMVEREPASEQLVLASLKEYDAVKEAAGEERLFLETYGYRSEEFCGNFRRDSLLLFWAAFFMITWSIFFSARYFYRYDRARITALTDYLERVNLGFDGVLIQPVEDIFSKLQDEIYKTVTMLHRTGEAAVAAKENFAKNLANIAHQLKTSITTAILSLQLIEETNRDCRIEQIGRQLLRLNHLEEAILALSRIDSGVLKLDCLSVDVYTVLVLASENLEELMQKKGIIADIPEKEGVTFCGDLEWTMEAFMNIMKNCMEHSPSGGTIHCEYSDNPLYVEIMIWDEGEGFAPEDLPHIFERFYQGKSAAGSGIGIGLALARVIFEQQNGVITAGNKAGGGAYFEIRFYRH